MEPRQPCDVQYEYEVTAPRAHGAISDVLTGPDGEFTLGPFGGDAAKLVARCPGGDQGELLVQVAPQMSDEVIAMHVGGSLSGRAVDPDGRPVPGVSVMANAPEALANLDSSMRGVSFRLRGGVVSTGEQALTDANGAFQINGLPLGSYGFQVLDRGRPLRPHRPAPVIALAAGDRR